MSYGPRCHPREATSATTPSRAPTDRLRLVHPVPGHLLMTCPPRWGHGYPGPPLGVRSQCNVRRRAAPGKSTRDGAEPTPAPRGPGRLPGPPRGTHTRYRYLQVSLRKKLSIRSSLDLSMTWCSVAYPHLQHSVPVGPGLPRPRADHGTALPPRSDRPGRQTPRGTQTRRVEGPLACQPSHLQLHLKTALAAESPGGPRGEGRWGLWGALA